MWGGGRNEYDSLRLQLSRKLLSHSDPSNLTFHFGPQTPQYRFHYYVKDDKTGDYKAQEEYRAGDSVTGTYMVGEPNGDLRVVNYAADVSNGFKADVSVQPGASPVKGAAAAANPPKDGVAAFNIYRTGISAPPRNRNKPARGFNPIVVKRLTPQPGPGPLTELPALATPAGHPYPYFKDTTNGSAALATQVTRKVSSAEASNDDSAPDKRDQKAAPEESGLQQLAHMAIPSSVIDIMGQNRSPTESPIPHLGDTTVGSSTAPTYPNAAIRSDPENGSARTTAAAGGGSSPDGDASTEPSAKRVPLPQRPMRLIGLSPIYVEIAQLQTIADNLTAVPQLQLEPFASMQYATPAPFQSGSLPGGPAGPFRNLPRAVSETNAELPLVNTIPIANSIPISAPIIPQSFASSDFKGDIRVENKTPSPNALPLCADCLLPTNYGPYPLVKLPMPVSNPSGQKAPCPPTPNNPPYWAPYAPSLAYILMPTQIFKGKFNETRF